MELLLQREAPQATGIFGDVSIDGVHECLTLENHALRIDAGRYPLSLEDSPHFGAGTLTINDVPGRDLIRIHGGTTEHDSLGCVLVGDLHDRVHMTIEGAKFHHVLERLKDKVRAALAAGDEVWLTVRDAV